MAVLGVLIILLLMVPGIYAGHLRGKARRARFAQTFYQVHGHSPMTRCDERCRAW